MKKINFNAGPSVMPQEVFDAAAKAVLDFNGIGLSILEISHRSKDFVAVLDEARALFKEILDIPDGYTTLFLGGGASMQFCMVPYNFLKTKAAYLNTGTWSLKALKEAQIIGEAVEVASSKDKLYSYIPKDYVIPADADYFHITTNNTIYGGAQKNLAPAGVAFAIVKEDALGQVDRKIPSMLNYRTHIDGGSMYNTPPVFPIYVALENLRWIKAQGGVCEMQRRAELRSQMLYDEVDRNRMFKGTAAVEDRSVMNIDFVMADEYKELEADFMQFATSKGICNIKGHRSIGGFRASCYNAMPVEGVQRLVDCMKEFEQSK